MKLDLNAKDNVAGFVDLLLSKREDRTIALTQLGLIQRISDVLDLQEYKSTKTSAQKAPLPLDKEGDSSNKSYNYASMVRMLIYLCSNPHPDITFDIHQYTRHYHNPKVIHCQAF